MKKPTKTFEELKDLKLTNDRIKKIIGGKGSSSPQIIETYQDRTHVFHILKRPS